MKIIEQNSRIVIYISYRPTLNFVDQIVSRASVLENDFTEWVYDGQSQMVLLYNDQKLKRVKINTTNIEMVIEKPESDQAVIDDFSKWFAAFFADSDVSEYRTFGSIMISLDSIDSEYGDYAEAFYRKIYQIDSELSGLFSDKIKDVVFIAEGLKDGFDTQVKYAPLRIEQFSTEYPKENYQDQVSFKKGTPILTRSGASSAIVTSKEEIASKVESSIKLAFNMHLRAREISTKEIL